MLKEKNCQPRILYPTKLSFKTLGEIKSAPDKQALREFLFSWYDLQEIPSGCEVKGHSYISNLLEEIKKAPGSVTVGNIQDNISVFFFSNLIFTIFT